MALNCSGSWEWWERKRPKQGTKANASLEDAATVCQHLCQLFKMQFFIFNNEKQPQHMAFSLWWAHSFSQNTSMTLSLSLESYQSVSHNLWCLTSNSSSCFPKAIAAFAPLTANQSLRSVRSLTAFSASQPSSSSHATPLLTSNSLHESSLPALLCS